MSDAIVEAVEKARRIFPRVRVTGPVEDTDIEALEKLIGASVPEDYRFFLKNYGTFGFYGLEVYGLIQGNLEGKGPPNAFFMTETDLRDGAIPEGSVVIGVTGFGPVYLLDCRGDGAVSEWNYSEDKDETAESYISFTDFFTSKVDVYLDDYIKENKS